MAWMPRIAGYINDGRLEDLSLKVTYLEAPDLYSLIGSMTCPFSSIVFSILNTARIEPAVSQTEPRAIWRPGLPSLSLGFNSDVTGGV